MDDYDLIFKRKSFHLFRDAEAISAEDLAALKRFIAAVKPLDDSIRTHVEIVPESETTCRRGAEYCILFYSESRGNYLRNIGYIGEQIDLFLAGRNIGALWFGIGRPAHETAEGLDYVIMIAAAKMPPEKFRTDMFRAKRKPLSEIWSGELLPAAEIVRFAPSACNTQPWLVEHRENRLLIYRYRKPGKRGIMPAARVSYYNCIDIGIFLYLLEVCLAHDGCCFQARHYDEAADDGGELVPAAEYLLPDSKRHPGT